MRMKIDKKAISIFILIILMLLSAVFGAIIAYLGVISNYYNMPENTTFLIVEDAVFPLYNATYFNVTILNPSNSASDINITAIRVSVEGQNAVYDVNTTEPALSAIRRGTRQTFKCKQNWSNFAGQMVRIEPISTNASIESKSFPTPNVKLKITPIFNPTASIAYFNITMENPAESLINLTISDAQLFLIPLKTNMTPTLPYVLVNGTTKSFRCDYNWETLKGQNATITVKTSEGYEAVYTTSKLLGAILSIQEVKFDYADTTRFTVTITSSEDSTATATISKINVTLQEGNTVVINQTLPQIGAPTVFNSVPKNSSRTFTCTWNWNTYRNKTVTVKAHTNEGFIIPNKTSQTAPPIIWNITEVKFDLEDTNHFSVNLTNVKTSLNNITITEIRLNQTLVAMNQTIVNPDQQKVINCTFDWKNFIGKNATVIVERDNTANISRTINIPAVQLKLGDILDFGYNATTPFPTIYFNLTISNSNNSLANVTVNRIVLEIGNKTFEIEYNLTYPQLGLNGYRLKIGETVTFMCEWDWTRYLAGASAKITVYTKEGFQVSRTY
jgi:hypothetical protein